MLDRAELKRPDAFLTKLSLFFRWLQGHVRVLIAVVAGAFLIAGSFVLYQSYRAQKEEAAQGVLFQVTSEIKDIKTITETQVKKIEDVATSHRGTLAAFDAYVFLADAYFKKGDFTKAADFYRKAVERAKNKLLKAFATLSLGTSLEASNQVDAAISEYEHAQALGEKGAQAQIQFALARLWAQKGDKNKASGIYSQIITENPNTAVAKTAEVYRARLQ